MNRKDILEEAITQVTGHREEDYGKIEDNFRIIAEFWTTYLGDKLSVFSDGITPKDVAVMMALLKVARIRNDTKSDSYVDLAGYAACAGEIAINEKVESR